MDEMEYLVHYKNKNECKKMNVKNFVKLLDKWKKSDIIKI